MNWGERGVSGDLEKTLFLRAVGKGRDREFFGDVWLRLLYADNPRQFTGRCGRVICTQEYIDHIERHIFGRDIPNYYGGRNGDRAYGRLIISSLENIAREIERDLEQGARDNDYIRDENADRLKEALKDLAHCGVRCYSLERKVDELAWFVGGDADKIREIQRMLNATGLVPRLLEDGVYGKETAEAEKHIVDRFRDNLEEFLLNEAAVEFARKRISFGLALANRIPSIPPIDIMEALAKVLFDNRQAIQRMIWKLGAEYYLRAQGTIPAKIIKPLTDNSQ